MIQRRLTAPMTKINSICILRISAIGDVTHVLPVLATLKNAFKEAQITWIIGKLEYKLMQGIEGVNFIIYDKKAGVKSIKKKLKGQSFDVLLQMQYSLRANRIAWKLKAKYRVGFDKKRSRELHGYKLSHRIAAVENQHVLDGFMEFAKVLGVNDFIYKWHIPTSKLDKEFAANLIDSKEKYVVLSPCSSHKIRNWSNVNYAKIIDYMINQYAVKVLLCGGPSEYEINTANEIESLCQHSVNNITGKDTLKQLYELLKRVDLVISPDSGPMHIANAARTPVIGLHAATTAKRSGAYLYQDLAVDCFSQAAEKYLNKPAVQIKWGKQVRVDGVMSLISYNMVKEKIDKVLG